MARKKNVEGEKKEKKEEKNNNLSISHRSPLVVYADAAILIEKARVSAQVRLTHLSKSNTICPHTRELLEKAGELEKWIDKSLADFISQHPAYSWFSRVKGTGGETIGKVLGLIEKFGHFYDVGDPLIPLYVKRCPEMVDIPLNGEVVTKQMIWVEAIERFVTPSKLRKYAGLTPDSKQVSNKKLGFNKKLRTMLRRLGMSFHKQKNKYYYFYLDYKSYLVKRSEREGIKIIPTPKGRYCYSCEEEIKVKDARLCPQCGERLGLKEEPDDVKFEGHIHDMAMRRMLQLFLNHLWVEWRSALKLPLRDPYPIAYLGHTKIVTPEEMCDN